MKIVFAILFLTLTRNDYRADLFVTARSDFRIVDWRNSDGGI
jgi:hypothetical protein